MTSSTHRSAEAVADIPDGATVMVGGFGASGSPVELLHALIDHGASGLTVINNNTGNGEVGLAALIGNGQVSEDDLFVSTIEPVEGVPEAVSGRQDRARNRPARHACRENSCRRRGHSGLLYAYGCRHGTGRRQRAARVRWSFNYVMEPWLKADFALVKSETADSARQPDVTTRQAATSAPLMCMAATTTIVQTRNASWRRGEHQSRARR